jgi:hypothetical protein
MTRYRRVLAAVGASETMEPYSRTRCPPWQPPPSFPKRETAASRWLMSRMMSIN